jgi:hypothetical protein
MKRDLDCVELPDGWTIEVLWPEQRFRFAVITSPPPGRYGATLDFEQRGFRSGFNCTSGRFEGEKITRRGFERKQYKGRGWMQAIVDDAVAHLRSIE